MVQVIRIKGGHHPYTSLAAVAMPMVRLQRLSFRLKASIPRFFSHLRLPFHIGASVEDGWLPYTTDVPDQPTPTDPDALCGFLVELGRHLRPLLPDDREWLEEGTIETIGDSPVDAGEVADILVGMKGNLKVAVKRYRFYSSVDFLPTYMVSIPNI